MRKNKKRAARSGQNRATHSPPPTPSAQELAIVISYWEAAAAQGDAAAQFHLSNEYESGRGVKKDVRRAAQLLQSAAKLGHGLAQFHLGRFHADGIGVKQDLGRCARLWEAAAKQGVDEAQFGLAVYYESGRGVKQDVKKALTLFQAAADQGHMKSQLRLAQLRLTGTASWLGFDKDLDKARRLQKSARKQFGSQTEGSKEFSSCMARVGIEPHLVCHNEGCAKRSTVGLEEKRTVKLKVCSGCRQRQYCSKECQLADWKKGHNKTCKQLSQQDMQTKMSNAMLNL